jgi:hypothetical protein
LIRRRRRRRVFSANQVIRISGEEGDVCLTRDVVITQKDPSPLRLTKPV